MMTAVIVIAFIVCWTPYWILYIITMFASTDKIDERAVLWIFFFGMANSMVADIIMPLYPPFWRPFKKWRSFPK